jgi:F0F1-type ATP synthase assembly protein I
MIQRFPQAIRLIGLGWYLAFCIVGGIVAGVLADEWLDTKPVLTLAGTFIGLATGFYGGYRLLMQVLSATAEETTKDE